MARLVLFDATPLGLACRRPGIPIVDHCLAWMTGLEASGVYLYISEIVDCEVRRELHRLAHVPGLRRLDLLTNRLMYAAITTPVMRLAAELWADVRRRGLPTASDFAIDADAILAAQATLLAGPGDHVTIATGNVSHLRRFPGIDAQVWEKIA
jgi:hypothetical protein